MASYQNEEGVQVEEVEINKRNWNYVILAAVLGVTGVLAVSSSHLFNSSSTSSSISKRLEMAKSGTIMYNSLSDLEKYALFDDFKDQFGKDYTDEEEEEKYSNFEAFLQVVDTRNADEAAAGGTAVHGVTKFADLSEDEFKTGYLGYKDSNAASRRLGAKKATYESYSGSSTVVNWAGVYTTSVKDQGYCGSCWAFSTAEQMESDGIRQGLLTTSSKLSPQQIVSCDVTNFGCNGGNTETAYAYVTKTGGLELESNYPYTSYYDVTGTCAVDGDKFVITVEEYYSISGETDMETHMLSTGPISVCLAASTWSSYTSGIMSSCNNNVDHCVQAVGLDLDNEYWIVRNSWGTDWGEDGYIYLKSGSNTCDISYDPTYTTVAKAK